MDEVQRRSRTGFHAALAANGLGFASYYLMLPVVPLASARYGGTVVVGATTAAFMGATILTQIVAPSMTERYGLRAPLAAGGLALSLPTLLYLGRPSEGLFFGATLVRGAGFGILTAVGSAAVMATMESSARGQQIGWYGLVASVPGVALPAAGVRLFHAGAADWTYVASAALALVIAPLVGNLHPSASPPAEQAIGIRVGARRARLRNWPLMFFPFTMAYGAVFTFIPLWEGHAAGYLLAFTVAFASSRSLLGRALTNETVGAALQATVLVAVGGALILAFAGGAALYAGSLLIGLGVGAAATISMFALTAVSTAAERAAGAALWSVAFDGGIGIGAIGLAAFADQVPHAVVYLTVAVAIAGIALPARRTDLPAR